MKSFRIRWFRSGWATAVYLGLNNFGCELNYEHYVSGQISGACSFEAFPILESEGSATGRFIHHPRNDAFTLTHEKDIGWEMLLEPESLWRGMYIGVRMKNSEAMIALF